MDKRCTEKEPLISIIVPVYNVEAYVERCIISLVSQSYQKIEIIMVDDGSTDKSGEICDEYKEKDSRIKVIHKMNGGVSDARNIGLNSVNGEYIAFVDSDDWVSKDYIFEMYKLMIQADSDIVTCRFLRTSKKKVKCKKENKGYRVYSQEEAIKRLLYRNIPTSVCGTLYKVALWNDVSFPFQKIYEEIEPTYIVFNKCSKIVCMSKILYYYYSRDCSTVNQKFSIKKMDYVENCKNLLTRVKSDYPQFEKAAISRLMWAEIHVLVHMDVPRKYLKEYKMLTDDIRQFRGIAIKDVENKWETRTTALLSYLGYGLLRAVFRLKRVFFSML